jgi:seryl-tRNA synthetase
MLVLQTVRENPQAIIEALEKKKFPEAQAKIQAILQTDETWRNTLVQLENLRSDMNRIAKSIGQLIQQGRKAQAETLKTQTATLKQQIARHEQEIVQLETRLHELLVQLPNLPAAAVPPGSSAEDNPIIDSGGPEIQLPANAKPHWELAAALDIIDFELGVKVTGAGFPVYKNKGARLQRALIHFFLDRAVAAGYTEIQPPILVNADSGFGTGQLPDKEGQMYYVAADNLYLIPTAEVPITNLYRDLIIEADSLPIRNCGYTPCFRREAGSYGKDVRGLNRLHQFDKVEIVCIVEPEHSYAMLETMCAHVAGLLQALELKYRRILLCGGDMSFASAQTYDFEVFSAAQLRWLEVSSVSNFESFQANRLKLRYRRSREEKPKLLHTLNGSALALPRVVAAILENHQQSDGSVRIPAVLVPYTGFEVID